MKVGANYLGGDRCEFVVWSPLRETVNLQIETPSPRLVPMTKDSQGYWRVTVSDVPPGTRYRYQLDGDTIRPDPASQSQPEDVHGPSQVVDHHGFHWEDSNWSGVPLADLIIYELHVGTFTPEGTFQAVISRIPELLELGITAIELMPVSQFPGSRNWGYDGVYPYGVQTSYGGPEGLKALVNACHKQGMAVVLDVVYNHFGPEGNYTRDFGPYFTSKYQTPWGSAINYDDAGSPGVRNFVLENVLYWFRDYHIDALRLDAIHAIYDFGAKHILEEMSDRVAALSEAQGRQFYLIAESDLNDVRIINPKNLGGYGIDAQWSDDFHHALRTLITGDLTGYYKDFGKCADLAKALSESFVYSWDYSPNRDRYHGSYAGSRPPSQFVVCCQNHDQIGNRMLGERLSQLASLEALKLAAATVLLSPYIPMLFMGEEYGETAPFLYFISHSDPDLIEAVRQGRKSEFEEFHAVGEPPDAQSLETFKQSILHWEKRSQGHHKTLLGFYKKLISLRHEIPAIKKGDRQSQKVTSHESQKLISSHRWTDNSQILCILNFNKQPVTYHFQNSGQTWHKQLDSSDSIWMGPGSHLPDTINNSQEITLNPESCILYNC
ncbi:MAG: malto-oligosyltrehalose trehalohydrolase [Limnospira sp. PMC 1291.21]|uniref:malto-oligosyltrehalose trehalohydrolase n=1 Tax=unclassified Limnospira TaxID=2642885 RepID=UPI0028E0F9DA|nr:MULTISPECIES: malto-oligosyltrehalose trehalohydrolase [unclassified Limnospira]MDT9178623.1 malto-oligosyltrehalose trehalohydrolase [Limnospira sp. PMC 1238.20]MDT9193885.1 malto-oligosyltrehalose trehalohydrolase [Limnospira sp. PMC 1245.20]MDT9204072.1 malto-oligosyltrehalose trehalohydrolase [Limnospira sp. PMC 1243.20]MDT9209259.1 malto-oligosyltrehalose trehalohydrolase [Limnospira sp. PMC 1252.20]MDT9214400.1 malto-oligosyltrehalose trehalohydrolase [Limnospira sp. PMC 1256.20]